MFPIRWIQLPCRNIETITASQTFLSGNGVKPLGEWLQAFATPWTWVAAISGVVSGRPWVSSQGMAAYS